MKNKSSIFVCILIFGYSNSELFEQDRIRRDIATYLLSENRYDSSIVPDWDEDFPTNVTVQIMIRNMDSINEVAMEYSVAIYLRMRWRDIRLDYREITNTTHLQKLELDTKQIEKVWQPNIYFENEKEGFIHTVTTTNRLMHLYRDGTVVYSTRLSLTMGCTMSLRYYPFDAQTCPLVIQSFCYTTDNIRLLWHGTNPVNISKLEMPQYTLLEDKTETSSYDSEYEELGTFSTLEIKLSLSRKIGYYMLQVFTPCIFLVVLSWVSFWVDPNAVPARVSLGLLCVLTMTTQGAVVHQSLPPVSYVKSIDVWMFVCLFFVSTALLEFACVNVILQKKADTETKKTSSQDQREKALRIDKISKYLFPCTFGVFAFTFFMVSGLA